MGVLLTYENLTKDKAWVNGRVYKTKKSEELIEIDALSAEEKKELKGHIINDEADIPAPPPMCRGKENLLMMDTKTKELFWEAVDRPLTEAEAMEELGDKLNILIEKQDQIIVLLSKSELTK